MKGKRGLILVREKYANETIWSFLVFCPGLFSMHEIQFWISPSFKAVMARPRNVSIELGLSLLANLNHFLALTIMPRFKKTTAILNVHPKWQPSIRIP